MAAAGRPSPRRRRPRCSTSRVDDQDHTAERLRSGAVLAAVTALAQPVAGCNSEALGTMHYVAAASPAFVARAFRQGRGRAQRWRARRAWCSTARTACRRAGCGASATATWRRRATGCRRRRPSSRRRWPAWAGACIRASLVADAIARRQRWWSWCRARRCRCRSTGSRRARRRACSDAGAAVRAAPQRPHALAAQHRAGRGSRLGRLAAHHHRHHALGLQLALRTPP